MAPLDGNGTPEEEQRATVSITQSVDDGGCPVIQLTGELDLSNVDQLRPILEAVIGRQPERLVVEISGLSFMDSSGIAILIEAAQGVGTLEVHRPSGLIRRILEATGLAEILRIVP